jgi:tetratricopeptide (TPR) repeat protein
LAAIALIYAFAAGLKTVAEFDLGWQMATGRWIVQHHRIPSTDVFSYTAAGRPWIYPVGSGLLFYGVFLLGGYVLISWMAAAACVGTVALLLRRGSFFSAALAILAAPLIASRTNARAEMFTMVLFAAILSLLWQQQESGDARLWLLPLLMAAWVNLHPGFVAGLGLLGTYVVLEVLKMLWRVERSAATERLRRSWPWLIATCAATLANPWGAKIYQVIWRQDAAMRTQSQSILEWAPIPMNWAKIESVLLWRDPDPVHVLLLMVAVAAAVALLRRQLGAAILLAGAGLAPLRHMRFAGLFAIVAVIVGGGVLTSALRTVGFPHSKRRDVGPPKTGGTWRGLAQALSPPSIPLILAVTMSLALAVMAARRVTDLVTDRAYLGGTHLVSFGAGLSWWFPAGAADFIQHQHLPGQIFDSYNEGGYLTWSLGEYYRDYIDGRAIPFGPELLSRNAGLMQSLPGSPAWQLEAERYDINVIILPVGRFIALQFFPALKQFCESDSWRPVYLDEVSVVFLRARPETEGLIRRLQIDCSAAPLPRIPSDETNSKAFNQWANAASVLYALGRSTEALAATKRALAIFPDSAYLHWTRAHMFDEAGNLREAEQEYLRATKLAPYSAASWSGLAAYYQGQNRWPEAIHAWESAANVSIWPWEPFVSLGYANLQAGRPKQALAAFDDAAGSLPVHSELLASPSLLANIAHGRARCWYYLGDLHRAIAFEEQAARILPESAELWAHLANLYDLTGRSEDANRIRARTLTGGNSQ